MYILYSPNDFLTKTTLDSNSMYLTSEIQLALSRPVIVLMVASTFLKRLSTSSLDHITGKRVNIQLVTNHIRVYDGNLVGGN